VRVPVLFTMQWDDERFERSGQLALFDLFGAKDKRLHAYPGQHVDNSPEAFTSQAAFFKTYLEAAGGKPLCASILPAVRGRIADDCARTPVEDLVVVFTACAPPHRTAR